MRNYKRNLTRFNHAFFSEIDTEKKAYWLGFIFADGFILDKVKRGSKQLGIRLAKKDKHQLEAFRVAIESNNKIYEYTDKKGRKNTVILHSSDQMCDDLTKYGCGPRKSLILRFPDNIPQETLPHFIRGYFDGDGSASISAGRLFVGFAGTEHFLNEIKRILGIENKLFLKNKIRQLTFSDQKKCKEFYHYLYDNATIFLKRKKDVFEKAKTLNRPGRGNYARPKRPIVQLTLEGHVLRTWERQQDAIAEYGSNVNSVLKGKKLHHKGYIWKYSDELRKAKDEDSNHGAPPPSGVARRE